MGVAVESAPGSVARSRLERSRTFHSFTIRNFRLYFVGQVLSFSGTNAQLVANGWLALELTNNGTALGVVAALQYVPTLTSSLWTVGMIERTNRLRMMKLTQVWGSVLAAVMFLLVITGVVQYWMLCVIALLFGVLQTVDMVSRQLLVGDIVGRDRLSNALGLNNMLFGIARIAGPAAAALVISLAGMAWCFLLNAVSYGALYAALKSMRPDENRLQSATLDQRATGTFSDVLQVPAAAAGLLAMAVAGLLTYQFWVTAPLLVHSKYDETATTLGLLFTVMSIGSVMGSLLAARRRVIGRNEILFCVSMFGLTTFLVGLAPTLTLCFAATFVMGVAYSTFITWGNTQLQLSVETNLRPKVVTLRTAALPGLGALGGPLVGWIGESYGASAALEVGGVAGLLAALAVAVIWKR